MSCSNEPTVTAIIQARLSSSRLPGKVLLPLAGIPLIHHIVERARACRLVNGVIVATSQEPSDDPLVEYCQKHEIDCFRGDLDNVLSRFETILRRTKANFFVRITGDCPLIHPHFIDKQIAVLRDNNADFIALTSSSSLLDGQGVHSSSMLFDIFKASNHPDDLEHVGSKYISENLSAFSIVGFSPPTHLIDNTIKLSVDESEDYEFMSTLYAELYKGEPIDFDEAIAWIRSSPQMQSINAGVVESAANKRLQIKAEESHIDYAAKFIWDGH